MIQCFSLKCRSIPLNESLLRISSSRKATPQIKKVEVGVLFSTFTQSPNPIPYIKKTQRAGIAEPATRKMRTKAEIDTSAPFRSVKEAVVLFGERVLAGEVYSNKLRQMQDGTSENCPDPGSIAAELEETKQSLVRARDESMLMANCLTSMQEELHHAKRELQHLKERKSEEEVMVVEERKFRRDSPEFDVKTETPIHEKVELQKKRYVTFADPPTVSHVMVPPNDRAVLQKNPSLKKTKKKPLIPLIKSVFRKKSSSEVLSA